MKEHLICNLLVAVSDFEYNFFDGSTDNAKLVLDAVSAIEREKGINVDSLSYTGRAIYHMCASNSYDECFHMMWKHCAEIARARDAADTATLHCAAAKLKALVVAVCKRSREATLHGEELTELMNELLN